MAVYLRHATGLLRPAFSLSSVESLHRGIYKANNSSNSSSSAPLSSLRSRKILKTCLGVMTGALATCGSILYLLDKSVKASGLEAHPPNYPWSMEGILSSMDHQSIRRGWHVFRTVCSTCHSLRYLSFKDLINVAYTHEEMKAIAAEYEIDDGPDDDGNYFKRPGKIFDRIPPPFPNDEAARAANNGALPVDLSYVVNARHSGKNYLFSLLTGYYEAPAGVELADGQVFNAYFPGGAISMPEMIQDGVVDYDDGTPASRAQIAKDVVEFLTWTSNMDWDARKVICMKGVGICAILWAIIANTHRQRWATMKNRTIAYVPKNK